MTLLYSFYTSFALILPACVPGSRGFLIGTAILKVLEVPISKDGVFHPMLMPLHNVKWRSGDKSHPTACGIVIEPYEVYDANQREPKYSGFFGDYSLVSFSANETNLEDGWLKDTHPRWCLRKALRRLFGFPRSGEGYNLCPGCSGYQNHAEALAVQRFLGSFYPYSYERLPKGVMVAYILGHWHACQPCLDKLSSIGVKEVRFFDGK